MLIKRVGKEYLNETINEEIKVEKDIIILIENPTFEEKKAQPPVEKSNNQIKLNKEVKIRNLETWRSCIVLSWN